MPRPDEGLIHAWLDGQLPPDEAARIEQLAATDPEWTAAVAEARGLVAASSRILSTLDDVPAGVIPKGTASRAAWRLPWWSKVAAAVVIMAGTSVLVMQRTSERVLATAPAVKPATVRTPAIVTSQPVPAPAVARNIRTEPAGQVTPSAPRQQRNEERTAMPLSPTVSAMVADAQQRDAVMQRTKAEEGMSRIFAANAAKAAPAAAPAPVPPGTPAQGATPAMRTVGGGAAPAAESALSKGKVGGVAGGVSVASGVRHGPCYRIQVGEEPAEMGVVMRAVRVDGDTLRLEPVQGTSPLRAWVVLREGTGYGEMTAARDKRSTVAVVAIPAECPAP